jgi:ligand-binding sensor domain-containing protein
MWFGTQDGLNKYDGYKFTIYRHDAENSASLSNSSIWSIFENADGNLWIGTYGGGLNKFNKKTETFTHYQQGQEEQRDDITVVGIKV